MGIIVGGPNAWKKRVTGDIVSAFHWINEEAAMVLFPVRPAPGASAFIICMSVAHKYARNDGGPTPYLLKQCVTAATVMGMHPDRSTLKRIADIILDGMEDLVKMPPEPPALAKKKGATIGEMSLSSGGKVIAEGEVDIPPGMMATSNRTLH